jgi:hypothetical protein
VGLRGVRRSRRTGRLEGAGPDKIVGWRWLHPGSCSVGAASRRPAFGARGTGGAGAGGTGGGGKRDEGGAAGGKIFGTLALFLSTPRPLPSPSAASALSLSLLDVCAHSHTRLTHSNCSWRQRRQRRQALPSLLQVVLTTTTTTTQVCVYTMYTVCTMCALLVCMRARSAVSFARTQPSLLVKPCWRAWSFLFLLLLTWLVPNCAGETELTSFTA